MFDIQPRRWRGYLNLSAIFFLFVLVLITCRDKKELDVMKANKNISILQSAAIDSLATKYIFFGHKSVGYNIMEGVQRLVDTQDQLSQLVISEIGDTLKMDRPGLYHKANGQNGLPKSKCDAFRDFLIKDRRGDRFDLALFKLCWADFTPKTDVKDLFAHYVRTVNEVRLTFPNLKIVHVTVPLYTHTRGIKGIVKDILRPDILNVKRNQFNQLLTDTYAGKEPLFDLAGVESTRPDGSRSTFEYEGKTYYSLHAPYSDDGGHLNDVGKVFVANELLAALASAALLAR